MNFEKIFGKRVLKKYSESLLKDLRNDDWNGFRKDFGERFEKNLEKGIWREVWNEFGKDFGDGFRLMMLRLFETGFQLMSSS